MKFCLLGASFDTPNMGVSALAESSIKVLLNRWPGAEILLLGSGRREREYNITISQRSLRLRNFPIRFCKNIFLPNHWLVLLLHGLLQRILPWRRFQKFLSAGNPYVKELNETDVVFDITSGDSFSDIYGMLRFTLGFLRKCLVLLYNKKLIMLPQTYGPFQRPITKMMAAYVLKRAHKIYSRDRAGIEYINGLLNNHAWNGKIQLAPDVAFVLDARKPQDIRVGSLNKARIEKSALVGLNISGLLFNGGYTQNNMFGLKSDYRELVCAIIDLLMGDERSLVVLVPHVFAPVGTVPSDPDACQQVHTKMSLKYPDRLFLAQGEYNHKEIKHIIGLCDFFIGSRMHSCIAAMSQCIPTVGLAYSKKFHGVFDAVNMAHCVVDARMLDREEILSLIQRLFADRNVIRQVLESTIPKVKEDIMNIFRDCDLIFSPIQEADR